MPTINKSIEAARGCGYRKKGGIYLVSGGFAKPCGLLPLELTVCPCCGQGIKPARGFTWVEHDIFGDKVCEMGGCSSRCLPFNGQAGKMGLLWVGGSFYPNTAAFMKEARAQGISRRIAQIPRDFVVGSTWVLLAHREVVFIDEFKQEAERKPAIFSAFLPERIEYVVKGDETEEELERLEKRGLTLVDVVRDIDAQLDIEN